MLSSRATQRNRWEAGRGAHASRQLRIPETLAALDGLTKYPVIFRESKIQAAQTRVCIRHCAMGFCAKNHFFGARKVRSRSTPMLVQRHRRRSRLRDG